MISNQFYFDLFLPVSYDLYGNSLPLYPGLNTTITLKIFRLAINFTKILIFHNYHNLRNFRNSKYEIVAIFVEFAIVLRSCWALLEILFAVSVKFVEHFNPGHTSKSGTKEMQTKLVWSHFDLKLQPWSMIDAVIHCFSYFVISTHTVRLYWMHGGTDFVAWPPSWVCIISSGRFFLLPWVSYLFPKTHINMAWSLVIFFAAYWKKWTRR